MLQFAEENKMQEPHRTIYTKWTAHSNNDRSGLNLFYKSVFKFSFQWVLEWCANVYQTLYRVSKHAK